MSEANSMLTPLFGLISGIALLTYAFSAYAGNKVLNVIPVSRAQKGNLPLAIGSALVALALMLGIVGYFNYINSAWLRIFRIAAGGAGFSITSYQIGKILASKKLSPADIIRLVISKSFKLLRSIKRAVFGFRLRRILPISEQWWAKYDLLRTLVRRDLEARYKGSVLGNLWPLLNQLSQLLIYTYVFSIVLKVKLSLRGMPENGATFGLWLFAGLLPWIAFTGGLVQAAGSVVGQPNLVKKVVFPLSLLPLVPILSTFIESSFGLMALILLAAVNSQTLHATLALLPLVWITQLLLTAGLGYLAAGITVFLRDIPQTIGVILNLWLYLTPIVYPASAIPPGFRDWIFWLNPMTAIAEVYRDLILKGQVEHWAEWGVSSIISATLFIGGFWVYKKLRPAFADVL